MRRRKVHKNNMMIHIFHDDKNDRSYSLDNYTLNMYSHCNKINITKPYQGLMVGGAVFFATVFVPRIADWIESQGLNDLYITARITMVFMAIATGILIFAIGRKRAAKTRYLTPAEYIKRYSDATEVTSKKDREEVVEKALNETEFVFVLTPMIFLIGLVLLYSFYSYSSSFNLFLIGTFCVALSGLLAIFCVDLRLRKKVIKQYQSKSINDINDSSKSHTSSSGKQLEINESETLSEDSVDNENSEVGKTRGIGSKIDWDNLSK
jgi:hypothetical protein